MTTVRRILDLDTTTDALLDALAAKRGQDAALVVAEAVELFDSVVSPEGPEIDEDIRRLDAFEQTGEAISGDAVKAWTDSWGTAHELSRPGLRKLK